MAQEITDSPPEVQQPSTADKVKNTLNPLRKRGAGGERRGPGSVKKLAHVPGYEARRATSPDTKLNAPDGRESRQNNESNISQELVDRFTKNIRLDMERIINMRRDFPSDQAFKDSLAESGHSYYSDLFDKLVTEKPNTKGRVLDVNEKALAEMMSTDKGVALAYQITMKRVQEEAFVYLLQNSPEEHLNTINQNPGSLEITDGGPGRGPARAVRNWWTTRRGEVNGRQRPESNGVRLLVDTKGNLTLTGLGAAGISGAIGGFALGPAGALIGPGLIAGGAGLARLFRRGETMTREVSANALLAKIWDADSSGANNARIEWMKKFHNIDPTDFESDGDTVRRRTDKVGNTGRDVGNGLLGDLSGHVKDLMDFQAENGIPPELRRPMDASWILQGSLRRPSQNTDFEKRVMNIYDPDRGGVRDNRGYSREVDTRSGYMQPEMELIDVAVTDATGRIQTDPSTGVPITEQVSVPRRDTITDADGNTRRVLRLRFNPNIVADGKFIASSVGEVQDSGGNTYQLPEMVPLLDDRGFVRVDDTGTPIEIPRFREATGNDLTIDPTRTSEDAQYRENPFFRPNDLDIAGNYDRWLQAEEEALKQEISEVFQGIVDGKTDHIFNFTDRLNKAEEGYKSGKIVEAERKKKTKEKAALEGDQTAVKAEAQALTDFEADVATIQQEVSNKEKALNALIRSIRITSGSTLSPASNTDTAKSALDAALGTGSSSGDTVTVKGQKILSIEAEYAKIDSDISARVDAYKTSAGIDALRTRITDAKTQYDEAVGTRQPNQVIAMAKRTYDALVGQEAAILDAAAKESLRLREDPQFKNKIDRIEQRRKLLQDALDEIITAEADIEEQQSKLSSGSEVQGKKDANLLIGGMSYAYDTLSGMGITGIENMSFDQLMDSVNSATSGGWPAEDNLLPNNRMTILHAMAEAKARAREAAAFSPYQPDAITTYRNLIDRGQGGLALIDIYSMSPKEISAELAKKSLGGPLTSVTEAQLAAAKFVAEASFGVRNGALQVVISELDTQVDDVSDELRKLDEKGVKRDEIPAIRRALGRYGEIQETITERMTTPEDMEAFFRPTKIDNSSGSPVTVFDEEQAYENIMNLLFNHTQEYDVKVGNQTGPKAAFERNKRVLSKDELADILYTNLDGVTTQDFASTTTQLLSIDRKLIARVLTDNVLFDHLATKIP